MSVTNKPDRVIHPSHYEAGGLEVKDIWLAKLSKEEFKGLCKGNIIKYVLRADLKNGLEDYRKAQVYLDWLIKEMEKKDESC